MGVEWVSLCRSRDLVVDNPWVDVRFGDDRRHRVCIEEQEDEYHLSAFVVRRSIVASILDLPVQVWLRNRATTLVGFRIDRRGALVGEAWVPEPGLTMEEFQCYVRTVAAACDRFEYGLTGRDIE